ncbi:hypothetical protein TNCV_1154401 [Trichonephila clavipes]|nr:hypothetical protein TNCV_1154401 [Trichonephila clavipes]
MYKYINLNPLRNSPRGSKRSVPISVYVTLASEVHEQMFQSGGQSDAKPPLLSSQAILANKLKREVDSDDVQELMDSHSQELTIHELIEIIEQEQDIKRSQGC